MNTCLFTNFFVVRSNTIYNLIQIYTFSHPADFGMRLCTRFVVVGCHAVGLGVVAQAVGMLHVSLPCMHELCLAFAV